MCSTSANSEIEMAENDSFPYNFDFEASSWQHYLCSPPSSVEDERLNSTLGNIYDDKRYNLTGEHAKAQLFLHHHWWVAKDC